MNHLFNKSNSPDPYAVLAAFFGREDMPYYCKVLRGALSHIHLPKVYLEVTPSSLMATLNDIAELIDAAFVISNDCRKGEVILDSEDTPKKDALLKTSHNNSFSGFLSEKEFKSPCKVLKKFFRIQTPQQWKKDLYTIIDFALCRSDEGCELNTLFTYIQLVKLLEALYFIDLGKRKV